MSFCFAFCGFLLLECFSQCSAAVPPIAEVDYIDSTLRNLPLSSSEFYNYTNMLGSYQLEQTTGDKYRCPKDFKFTEVETPVKDKIYSYRCKSNLSNWRASII